jgi:ribosome-associated protein YbcJ (S4-like RNA binding protein)
MDASVYQNSHSGSWRLQFLRGPQHGRSVLLRQGENWIGSGADCEIVLADNDVEAKQLLLQVGDIAASIRNIGTTEVKINGEPLARQRRSLVPGDVLSMGKIQFEIDQVSAAEEAADMLEPAEQVTDASSEANPQQTPETIPRPFMHRLMAAYGGVASVVGVLLLAVGIFTWAGGWGDARNGEHTQAERIRELQQALTRYPELVLRAAGGRVTVSGYVSSGEERRQVQDLVQRSGTGAVADVHVVGDLLARARQYFSDTQLSIAYDGQGHVVISGTADRESVWQRVRNFAEDIRSVAEVVDKVQYELPQQAAASGPAQIPAFVGVYLSEDGARYLQTASGARYFEGARLQDGSEVVSIALDEVLFTKNGQPLHWRIGRSDKQL